MRSRGCWHTAVRPATQARPVRGARSDARILLVEDDPSIREVTAIGLRNAGFTVETASDGAAGLERFASADLGRVAGNANVFESAFRAAVLDAAGKILVDQQVMATCGTGCRGTFDFTLHYTVSKGGQWGTLRVYDLSAKDGTPQDIREYPVWLTLAG